MLNLEKNNFTPYLVGNKIRKLIKKILKKLLNFPHFFCTYILLSTDKVFLLI